MNKEINNTEITDKITNEVTKKLNNKSTASQLSTLLDKDNNKVSSSNFYLISVTVVGLLLLIVPMIVLIIEAICNHTVTTDLNGMAAYIVSVSTLFATGGIVKGWINSSDNKAKMSNNNSSSQQDNNEGEL